MLDTRIVGGTIVDGTGSVPYIGDVGIKDGRIVALGRVDEAAVRTINADGLAVTPGFIDVHTHYDAQAFWDTTLSPSPLHGVTTVFGGNCGFTIAPLAGLGAEAFERDGDYLMRMLARVEGMPLESLQKGVPWDWRSTADYLNRLEGTLMPNAGFMVGHSAIRRVVMGDAATSRHSTPEELDLMVALLRDGLAAGGMGLTSTWSTSHNDHNGDPVPSRAASRDELVALCRVVRDFPGTSLEFIPQVGEFTRDTFQLMTDMSLAAQRPLNWNLLQIYSVNRESVDHQLGGGDFAEAQGGRVVALALPDSFRLRLTFKSGFVLDILNGWDRLMALDDTAKLAMMSDPSGRTEMERLAQTTEGTVRSIANWGQYIVAETFAADNARFVGRTIGDIATELGQTTWDTLCDIVVADKLMTALKTPDRGQDEASWERRVEVFRDHRCLVGASDAGAHLDMIDTFAYSTQLLGNCVRKRSLMPIEEAIQLITDAPAKLYGVTDRGRLAVGMHADIVVLDPARIGTAEVHTKFDLPGGAGRIYAGAEGIEHVLVNGAMVVEGPEFTDARPGTLIRSGSDTTTVSL